MQANADKWDDGDDEPIVPNSDRIEIPPVDRPVAEPKRENQGALPIGALLGGGALLLAAYAAWTNLGLTARIASLEERPTLRIEDMAKLQNQELQALSKRIDEQQKQIASLQATLDKQNGQKGGLESSIEKLNEKHKADVAALMQRQASEIKTLNEELKQLKERSLEKAKKAAEVPAASPPAAKPKPVVRKPVEDRTELPGPIESASEVEQPASSGAADRQASWGINIVSLESEEAAIQEVERLKGLGLNAEILETSANGRAWYRVRVAGFASKDEAQQMQSTLAKEHGITGTWVNNQ